MCSIVGKYAKDSVSEAIGVVFHTMLDSKNEPLHLRIADWIATGSLILGFVSLPLMTASLIKGGVDWASYKVVALSFGGNGLAVTYPVMFQTALLFGGVALAAFALYSVTNVVRHHFHPIQKNESK